jgi:hypothetical protein
VAQQSVCPEQRADDCLLRPPWHAPPHLTSTSRTARCGPACRGGVVGDRPVILAAPMPITMPLAPDG